jgi:hypothetical protein
MVIPSEVISHELRQLWVEHFGFEIEEVVQESGSEIPILNIKMLVEKLYDSKTAQYMPEPWFILVAEKKGGIAVEIAKRVKDALWPKSPDFEQCERNLGDLLAVVQEHEC